MPFLLSPGFPIDAVHRRISDARQAGCQGIDAFSARHRRLQRRWRHIKVGIHTSTMPTSQRCRRGGRRASTLFVDGIIAFIDGIRSMPCIFNVDAGHRQYKIF
jgi:hypothetical protein